MWKDVVTQESIKDKRRRELWSMLMEDYSVLFFIIDNNGYEFEEGSYLYTSGTFIF